MSIHDMVMRVSDMMMRVSDTRKETFDMRKKYLYRTEEVSSTRKKANEFDIAMHPCRSHPRKKTI
jgi:hypothetical protein